MLTTNAALYESCLLAIGVAFGGKDKGAPEADISKAPKSMAEMEQVLSELF